MAEAPKKDAGGGFDFFGMLKSIKDAIYKALTDFIDDPVKGFQFTPYYITAIFLYFFFAWIPLHAHATAVWFPIFIALVPFVLAGLLYVLVYDVYYEYQRQKDYWSRQYCVLEIRLPDEIPQDPYAMELVLRGLYQTGGIDTGVQQLLGATKPWFSLEIVSTEGRVRFYMWGQRSYKELMENQIYAHYPTVQVVEVVDYTLQVPFDSNTYAIWGVEQRLQKPDPYPIVTYKSIGTYLEPKKEEEFKHDPLASVIEFMGSLGEGEHMWIQFIIRAHEPASATPPGYCAYADSGASFSIHQKADLAQWTKIEIDKIIKNVRGEGGGVNFASLTKGDRDQIEAMQTKLTKQPFDTGIRGMYIARHDKYRGAPRTALPSAFRAFEYGSSGRGLNGLVPVFWISPFNYPWQDFRDIRRTMLRKRYYDAYTQRQFFWLPHRHRWIVLNVEELATLYHFPGRVIATPNLERMPSRRGEAPANLPT